MLSYIKSISNLLFSYFDKIISHDFCAYCKDFLDSSGVYCSLCLSKLTPVASLELKIAKKFSVNIYCVAVYKYPIKSLVLAKLKSEISAAKQLGILCAEEFLTLSSEIRDIDYIIPVPLNWRREVTRGYNQAEIMACEISKKINKPVLNAVTRLTNTKYQSELNKKDREANVSSAFSLNKNLIDKNNITLKDKSILLIDDLYTSGSTVKAISKVLYLAKVKRITVLVAARAVNI